MKLKPISEIHASLGIQPNGPVQKFFTDRCEYHMRKFVPYSGDGSNDYHLRESTYKTADSITYESPYAHAQYVGYTTGPVVNYTTPGTGPYWDKQMWSAEKDQVIEEVQRYVNGRR